VEPIEVADGARVVPPTKDRAVARRAVPEPAESYRTKRHALDLIERGNVLGAWGAAEHLHSDLVERQWTQVVEWLARFAASLPMSAECDIPVLAHKHKAVCAGIRVELALRAGDVPRAVHGTVAFFAAALWDHLSDHVQCHPNRRRQFQVSPAPSKSLLRSDDADENENRKRPFKVVATEDGIAWYWIFDDDVCAIRLAKHYLQESALEKLGQVISERVRELRHDVAHNEPMRSYSPGIWRRTSWR
jgi:hypothetical protein